MKTVIFTQLLAEGGLPRVMLAPYQFDQYVEYRLGQTALPMRDGVFSSDGYWVAFESWEAGGGHNIYVIAVTGAGRTQVTTGTGQHYDVDWKPVP
jgi:Tol biopolymer transport system component